MKNYTWTLELERIFRQGVAGYQAGTRGAGNLFQGGDAEFLRSIGCTAQELYDFAEDHVNYGEPDFGTVLAVTAVRRDYFRCELDGKYTGKIVPMEALPAKTDQVDGIEWLPRLLVKAKLKLRGEMNPDLMYGCGGDRAFFKQYDIHPADFLRMSWMAGDNDRKLIDYVKSRSGV